MRKLILLWAILLTAGTTFAQTKVIAIEAGRQKIIDLDSIYLAKGQVAFFRGTETGHILVNADKKSILKTWIAPDTIQLNNGKINHIVFVFQGELGTLQNEFRDYVVSDEGWKGPYGIYRIDSSSNVNIGGQLYKQYIEYWAEMKYKLGPIDSAGEKRRLVYNWYYNPNNPNWHTTIPWVETRRWKRKL